MELLGIAEKERIDFLKKDLVAASGPDGGYFILPDRASTISTRIFESSPLRPLCEVVTTTSDTWEQVLDDDEFSSGWVGEVEARASVVTSLEEAQGIAPGSILVARSIDPAWTPVLAKAAGLVLEVGGVLSHPSIVAREFQLPAVTSVPGASSLITDGQVVHIDGSQGTVRIISN